MQQAAAEQARHEEAAQKRAKARHEREAAERQAEQQAAVQRAQDEAERRAHDAAAAAARTVTAAQTSGLRVAEDAVTNAQRVGAEIRGAANTYVDAMKTMVPNSRTVVSLPKVAVDAMTEIRSAWIEWMSQTTRAGTPPSQDLVRQAAEQQQRFAVCAVQNWMEHNARMMQITMRIAQEGFRPVINRSV